MAKQVLNNVKGIILYAAIQEPKLKYKSTTEFEWSVQVAVDKDTAKAWKKAYKKQPVKEYDREEFLAQFKLSELHESYDGVDEFYVVTLKRGTTMKKKGSNELIPVPENMGPKVLLKKGSVQEDITNTKLVANGSLGVVSIFHKENEEFGDSAGLKNILVTNLIEFVKTGGEAGDEFGEFMDEGGSGQDEFGEDDAPAAKSEKPAKASKEVAKEVAKSDLDDSDLPF